MGLIPELAPDLIAALASLNMDNLPHIAFKLSAIYKGSRCCMAGAGSKRLKALTFPPCYSPVKEGSMWVHVAMYCCTVTPSTPAHL